MLIAFAASLLLTAAPLPQSQTTVVPRVSANFFDNERRNFATQVFRENRQSRREATRRNRMALATRLDLLIGAGRCTEAEALARRHGHADIVQQVIVVCFARDDQPPHDVQAN